jgi:pyrimidine-nucleoside phosphorylase
MNALEVIGRKRDGHEHAADEIAFLVSGCVDGSIPDYQVTAWLMAVCTRGMTRDETLALTQAMVDSGEVLDLGDIPGVKVDKHSTGGVGDKVTLIAGPLAAACGVVVPKLSGRALAHTGGTLDKLESVPGVTVELSPDRFREQVRSIGLAVAAQSPRMVPADRALYALRDASATVPSVPLIASSVMSKKLAAGADAIVLDVKFGRGAFMPDVVAARELATEMVAIGHGARRRTVALVTAMDSPLGRAVGNAVEVLEAIEVLEGRGDQELTAVAVEVAQEMCNLAGVSRAPLQALADGSGLARLWAMLEAQGGNRERPPVAHRRQVTVRAAQDGWVAAIDALACGLAVIDLGGGRLRKDDRIDHGAGLQIEAAVGTRVRPGEALVHVLAASPELAHRVLPRLERAWSVIPEEVPPRPHVADRIGLATPLAPREGGEGTTEAVSGVYQRNDWETIIG